MDGYDACKHILQIYKQYNYNKLIYGNIEDLKFNNEYQRNKSQKLFEESKCENSLNEIKNK